MATAALAKAMSPEHLTAVLRRNNRLGDGNVDNVEVISTRPTIFSQVTRLHLSYRGASDAPAQLFLKTAHADRDPGGAAHDAARQEVAFYTDVVPLMTARLVPHCFEAHWDADPTAWHLLLEDLTDSHDIATQWPLPPTMAQCESIMRARARFHAAWWNDARLGVSLGTRPDPDAVHRHVEQFAKVFANFIDRYGDCLSREHRALFEQYLLAAPKWVRQRRAQSDVTVIQHDAHVWNCFLPKQSGSDDVRLFDWDGWRIAPATDDLAYMMAVHWYPAMRREREQPLLDCYHATLLAHGVSGYDRETLTENYRASVLARMTTPIWQASFQVPLVIWWNNLGRILLAVDDLDCRALLG